MPDLKDLLRPLDDEPMPDRWERIQRRPVGPLEEPRRPRRAVAFVAAGAAAFLLVAVIAALGPLRSGTPTTSGEPAPAPRSATKILDNGQLRCKGTVPDSIAPAEELSVSLRLTNVGSQPVELPIDNASWAIRVATSDGVVYDSAPSGSLQPVASGSRPTVRPGGSMNWTTASVPVQWDGPLSVVATCAGEELQPLTVPVVASGATPDPSTALRASLRRTGGLFRDCKPEESGVPVRGLILSPRQKETGDHLEMTATCEATVTRNEGFDLVAFSIIAPPDADVQIQNPDGYIPATLPARGPGEGIVWRFVVTAHDVTDVGGSTRSHSWPGGVRPANSLPVPDFTWDGSRWWRGIGSCGGGIVSAGPKTGTIVQFISVCPRAV